MTGLPPGWWVKNFDGDFAGPPPMPEDYQDVDSETEGTENGRDIIGEESGLDIQPDSPGWEDMEVDAEEVSVQCLLCPQTFPTPGLMLDHCKGEHSFDFVETVRSYNLDFYKTIKYVNLVRSRVQNAVPNPSQLDATSLDPDELLKPVLDNDALLFTLDDVINFDEAAGAEATKDGATSNGVS
jgi:hypothetical protein